MFLNHFNMTYHPFTENPPIEWILNDDRFDYAIARLKFFLEQGNIALISGQTGIGKSSLLRLFIQSIPKNRCKTLYLHLTNMGPAAFLRSIVTQLGESPKLGKDRLFLQIMERIQKNETQTIIIVDEAHLVPSQSLIDLRLLVSSMENPSCKIILAGQEPLISILNRSVHADLMHRISVRCRLIALSKTQTTAYIDHRLHCAKASEKLFEPGAKNIIHDYSGGIPRQINNISTACLINAAAKNQLRIDEMLVTETMFEFNYDRR